MMARILSKSTFTVGLLIMLLSVPAFAGTINKSIKIGAGEESGGATSVNGSISVGEKAVVSGDISTVNGTIRVDDEASIEEASTVNGGVRLGASVQSDELSTVNGSIQVGTRSYVDGEVSAVNGRIELEKGVRVAEDVGNVNGQIELNGAEVGGNLTTVNGDIELADGAVVKGDLVVEKPNSWNWGKSNNRTPRVVIGPGCTVGGEIRLEREVELFISESAEVGGVSGVMSMDDAVRFTGNKP